MIISQLAEFKLQTDLCEGIWVVSLYKKVEVNQGIVYYVFKPIIQGDPDYEFIWNRITTKQELEEKSIYDRLLNSSIELNKQRILYIDTNELEVTFLNLTI